MQRPTRDDVRAEFVGIAAALFADRGFSATSLDDIAAEAGYSKAAVLYHFGSKDDLLAAVMEHHIDATTDLVAGLESEPAGPQRVENAIHALVTLWAISLLVFLIMVVVSDPVATLLPRNATARQR